MGRPQTQQPGHVIVDGLEAGSGTPALEPVAWARDSGDQEGQCGPCELLRLG